MVGIPIIPVSTDPALVMGFSGNDWWAYNQSANTYAEYPDSYTWLSPVQSTPGRGFWFHSDSPVPVPMGEIPPQNSPVSISLTPGWNMFGQPFLSNLTWSVNTVQVQTAGGTVENLADAADCVADYVWGWQPDSTGEQSGSYFAVYDQSQQPAGVNYLQPWSAYWIYAYKACTLILPGQ
jgi:hypothetical protein